MKVKESAIWIKKAHWDLMLADVADQAPLEACGLVAGRDHSSVEVFPVENELHSPSRFRMEPNEQIRIFHYLAEAGLDLLAIYHSHPDGPAGPSQTDIAEAAYPEVVHLIWSQLHSSWTCQGYLIDDGKVRAIPIYIQSDDP